MSELIDLKLYHSDLTSIDKFIEPNPELEELIFSDEVHPDV